jgi:hypothetical protein
MQSRNWMLQYAAVPFLAGVRIDPVFACSLVDAASSTAASVTTSSYYWIASSLVGGFAFSLSCTNGAGCQ